MNSVVKKGLYCALFIGGLSVLGIGAANAAETSGSDGVASGSQLAGALDAPITLDGNAISVVGDSSSGSAPAASTTPGAVTPAPGSAASPSANTSGTEAIAAGSQALVNAVAPLTVSGNAISVLGDSSASGAPASAKAPAAVPSGRQGQLAETNGTESLAGGTQAVVDAAVPISATGNAVSVLGDSSTGGAPTASPRADGGAGEPATTGGGDTPLGGTQVIPMIAAPVAAGANSISVTGASSSSRAVAAAPSGTPSDPAQVVAAQVVAASKSNSALIGTRSSAGDSGGESMTAAAGAPALATAGIESAPLIAVAAVFPIVGFGLLLLAHRHFGRPNQRRPNQL